MSEPFDFEAFIAGTQLARRTTGFYRKDHRDEIDRLQAEHDALPVGDDREGSKGSRRKIAERIKALRDEMEASRVPLVIRTLTPDEFRKVSESDVLDVYDQLAMQSVEPALTKDQVRRLADVIGAAQWGAIVSEANALITSRVAVPDFSRSVSETLSPSESSEN